jgi:hypothetical protein
LRWPCGAALGFDSDQIAASQQVTQWDALSKPLLSITKSLTEQRAVNRPLTEYAQFVNQSDPPGRWTGAVSSFNANAADDIEPPFAADGSDLACGRHAERLSSE